MLSKRYYKEIAKIVNLSLKIGDGLPRIDTSIFIDKLADYFKEDNYRFNRERFINACYDSAEMEK